MSTGRRPPEIARLSSADLTNLATDHGSVPMQIGAVLLLDDGSAPAAEELVAVVKARLLRVPRLGERLRRPLPGCGRPFWETAPHGKRGSIAVADAPAGDKELISAAVDEVLRRLPPDRPLWRAVVYADTAGRARGLLVVMHHVLADGIGGLAVLAELVDTDLEDVREDRAADTATPTRLALARDAWSHRWAALRSAPAALHDLAAGLRELGGVPRPRAAPTSLLAPTSPRRRVEIVEVDLAPVADAARTHGATVNDLLLVAVAGALRTLLAARGERLDEVVVSVPVSGRRSASARDLGNHVGVLPVAVPLTGDAAARFAAVRAQRARLGTSAPRASSAAVVSAIFRVLAALGLFQPFVRRQRLVHTFLTNLRGPTEQLSLAGTPIRRVLPVATVPGNVTVSFDVLSYAGRLTVCVVYDPEHVPDHALLRDALEHELAEVTTPTCAEC